MRSARRCCCRCDAAGIGTEPLRFASRARLSASRSLPLCMSRSDLVALRTHLFARQWVSAKVGIGRLSCVVEMCGPLGRLSAISKYRKLRTRHLETLPLKRRSVFRLGQPAPHRQCPTALSRAAASREERLRRCRQRSCPPLHRTPSWLRGWPLRHRIDS